MKVNLCTLTLYLVSVASAADLPEYVDQLVQPSDKTQTLTFGAPDQPDYGKISVGPHVIEGGVVHKQDLPGGGYARTSSHVTYMTTETIPDKIIGDVKKMISHAVKDGHLIKKDQDNTPQIAELETDQAIPL